MKPPGDPKARAAWTLAHLPTLPAAPAPAPCRRRVTLGDPQTDTARAFSVLAAHDLLSPDGWLRREVGLVCMGDLFDFNTEDVVWAGAEGLAFARWLAAHDPAQVTLLLGNHDLGRLQELAGFDDARFAQARRDAVALDEATFLARYPALPTPEVASRDFSAFHTAQADWLRGALVEGRVRLASAEALADGRPVLLTHAGVTERERALLGVAAEPGAIAAALEERLRDALEGVRRRWEEGHADPLDLEPLHVAGREGVEGGGLLYHRPVDPAQPVERPAHPERRVDPRALPRGLWQVCGHTQHRKCLKLLGRWATEEARALRVGASRVLVVGEGEPRYAPWPSEVEAGAGALIFVDNAIHDRSVAPGDYDLLELRA